jgi:hypothetical protein
MHDGAIPTSKLITATLWGWVALVILTAWLTWFLGYHGLAMMFGFTACALSAVAAASQIRCYSLRLCGVIRAVSGPDEGQRGQVRPLR